MKQLDGKTAIILGASAKGNLGQTLAQRFLAEGANVVISGRREEELAEFTKTHNCAYKPCDITKKADCEALAAFTQSQYGCIDIAINSTGWGLLVSFLETSEEDLAKMTALQFVGPYYFYQAVIPHMTQGGSLIQISSATATIMLDNHAAYMGTKAGTDHVMRCIANEFGEKGIRANSISPGLTDTPMTEGAFAKPEVVACFAREYPLGRVGTKEDIADAAVWLSQDGCFMTGQNLQVNGGLTLRRNPRASEISAAFMAPQA